MTTTKMVHKHMYKTNPKYWLSSTVSQEQKA